jgi:hypothetical protein
MKHELKLITEDRADEPYLRMAMDAPDIFCFIWAIAQYLKNDDVPDHVREHFWRCLEEHQLGYVMEIP